MMKSLVCLASHLKPVQRCTLLSAPLKYCSVPMVRSISQLTPLSRKTPAKFGKAHQMDATTLADFRYALARDNIKHYTEGDRREEVLEMALADNKAARNLKLDTKYFLQLLEILCAGGRYQQLIDEVDANIFVYSNHALLEYRAYAYIRLKNYRKALEDTDYLLKHARSSDDQVMDLEELFAQKADCEIELGEYEVAFKTIKSCLQRGMVLEKAMQIVVDKLDNFHEALDLLSTEIPKQAEPNAEMLLCRASFHLTNGDAELALADYNAAPDSERKREFFIEYGSILGRLGRFNEEIQVLQSALEQNESMDLREYLVQKHLYLFQVQEACNLVKDKVADVRPPAAAYLGEALLLTGDFKNALKMLDICIAKEEANRRGELEDEDEELHLESDTYVLSRKQRNYYMRAVCHVALGNTEQALNDLLILTHPTLARKALESLVESKLTLKQLSTKEFGALATAGLEFNTGLFKKASKKYEEAEAHFTRALGCEALNHFPFHVLKMNMLLARASCYEPLKRFSNALEDCTAALQIFPSDNKKIFAVQQSCLSAEDKYSNIANIILSNHLLNDPLDSAGPHLALALAYAGVRPVYRNAYEELFKCEHKNTHEWQKLLCTVTHELYRAEESIQAVNTFLARDDVSEAERGYAYLLRAENRIRCLFKEKKVAATKGVVDAELEHTILTDIQQSLELYPEGKEEATKIRAQFYYTFTDKYEEALRNFSALSDKMIANLGIAQCLKAIGKTEEATRHLETLLEGTEQLSYDGGVVAFTGSVLFQLGKYKDAIENYSKAMTIRSNDEEFLANCYQQRAEAYQQLGDTQQAENDLKKAAELNPNRKEEYALLELQLQFKKSSDSAQLSQQ